MLDGMAEIAEQIFDLPIRRGYPMGVGGLIDHVSSPEFATAVGLVMYAHRNHADDARMPTGGALSRVAVKLRGLFREFLCSTRSTLASLAAGPCRTRLCNSSAVTEEHDGR